MGADGGTIPTRCELVTTRKKPEQKDKESVRVYKWQYCNLTQQPLVKPIVACELGRLYNKEAIIEKLLESKAGAKENGDKVMPDASTDHIKSLKDVKELQLTDNPAHDRKTKEGSSVGGEGFLDRKIAPYICPISGLEMSGRFKFVFDWTTGKVYSDRALKVVNSDKTTKINEEDLVVLNPEEKSEDSEMMETKMLARRARAKALKKAAKEAKRKHVDNGDSGPSSSKSSKTETSTDERASCKNGTTSTNEHMKDKKPKSESSTSKSNNSNKTLNTQLKDKLKSTVQNDSSKSEVYKSLFSSHKSAQNKKTGHWITFDPRYN